MYNRVDMQRGSMDHSQTPGSIPRVSRQTRASDLRTEYVEAPRVDTDSDYAGCVLTRNSTTCAYSSMTSTSSVPGVGRKAREV